MVASGAFDPRPRAGNRFQHEGFNMRVALGIRPVSDERLRFAAQVGAEGVTVSAPTLDDPDRGYYEYAPLMSLRTQVESHGLRLEALENSPWPWTYRWMLGLPGRDEQIENYQKTIRNMGAAGIPILSYNMHAMRFYRTSQYHPARAGSRSTSFDIDLVKDAPLMASGPQVDTGLIPADHRRPITDDDMWANFEYFIKAVVPVAEEAGVKLALHPDDPPIPSIGGVARIMREPDAFRRAVETVPSDSNGLLFCQGCWTEMEADLPKEIAYFGSRKKIFYVHFRNVSGPAERFAETFPEDGVADMVATMKAYRDAGFDGPMIPDHAIHMDGDTEWGHRYWAYTMGHMRALREALWNA